MHPPPARIEAPLALGLRFIASLEIFLSSFEHVHGYNISLQGEPRSSPPEDHSKVSKIVN